FDAALFEGWLDALANGDIERIRDLWTRRISFAMEAVTADSASGEQYKPCEICTTQSWCETHGCQCYPVSAVQPERCCVDYPRCDCNSPAEANLNAEGTKRDWLRRRK
ncbi:MAG: hypothetical protein KAZ88_12960, partial [Acidimicrobiia bacterium]|nr:hypothetical protein [Acidimicrobiia bacterium]